jgi:hypothetical protein
LRRLERQAAGRAAAPRGELHELARLLDDPNDPIKGRWQWLVYGRYLALSLRAAGRTNTPFTPDDVALFDSELDILKTMHPLAIPMARKHLIDAGLFDAGELERLDDFAPDLCPA